MPTFAEILAEAHSIAVDQQAYEIASTFINDREPRSQDRQRRDQIIDTAYRNLCEREAQVHSLVQ